MTECPGPLCKGDLGPFHHHCLAHFQSYRLSVGRGLCLVLLWWNLIRGGGNRWATTSSKAWATSFNSSSNARNCAKMSTFSDLLNFFSLFLFLCWFCTSLAIFFVSGGHKSSLSGALTDFNRLYLVPTLSHGSWGTVCVMLQSGIMSTSGSLSG